MPPRLIQLARNPSPDDEVSLDTLLSMPLKTACRLTGFSSDCVYDLIRAGEIQSFTMGHRRFVIAESLRQYLARRAAEPLAIRRGPNTRDIRDGLDGRLVPRRHRKSSAISAR